MQLKLYNTITKEKELFIPLEDNFVSMYVCGPTVYAPPHLGNGLSIIVFDLLYRVLRYIYGKENVCYVRNITDIDDKINQAAKQQNISPAQLTAEITEIFTQNAEALNCLKPNREPKVSDHVNDIIVMIKQLINNGYAYVIEGHVFFSARKFDDYGKIAGKKIDDLMAGVRIAVQGIKKDPADFVLWKPAHKDDVNDIIYKSPWGDGRPGWHIECSAMSCKYLGSNFDIHGGGIDLVFPHHTNEIAQSCAANLGSKYASIWVHNGFLTVNGEKMSKSLGNFITIDDLLRQGIDGEIVRFHLLSSHYRKPSDWSESALRETKKKLDSFYKIIAKIPKNRQVPVSEEFISALLDDLNTPKAYTIMYKLANEFYKNNDLTIAAKLKSCGNLIGVLQRKPEQWFANENISIDIVLIEELMVKRRKAKLDKDYQLADRIRQRLTNMNIIIEDNKDGTSSWRYG